VAIPASFAISAAVKQESKAPVSTNLGNLASVEPLRPLAELTTASAVAGSMPKRVATVMASAVMSMLHADMRLFSALMACPAPTGPTYTIDEPSGSRSGRTRSYESERACHGAADAAGDRQVDELDARLGQTRGESARTAGLGGAHVDDPPVAGAGPHGGG
jgi:hypothetical protein